MVFSFTDRLPDALDEFAGRELGLGQHFRCMLLLKLHCRREVDISKRYQNTRLASKQGIRDEIYPAVRDECLRLIVCSFFSVLLIHFNGTCKTWYTLTLG